MPFKLWTKFRQKPIVGENSSLTLEVSTHDSDNNECKCCSGSSQVQVISLETCALVSVYCVI